MKHVAHRFVGSQRIMQVFDVGVPFGLILWLQAPEPFQAERDMRDFIAMDGSHDGRAFGIAGFQKILFELQSMVQVSAFKSQRQSGQVFEHRLKRQGFFPDVAIDGQITKRRPQRCGPLHVHQGVPLFVLHDMGQPQTERLGGGRKRQHDPGHHFQGLQFVIGHNVVSDGAPSGVGKCVRVRHRRRFATTGELQIGGPRRFGDSQLGPRIRICKFVPHAGELLIERIGEQNLFGKRAQFHRFDIPFNDNRHPETMMPTLRLFCSDEGTTLSKMFLASGLDVETSSDSMSTPIRLLSDCHGPMIHQSMLDHSRSLILVLAVLSVIACRDCFGEEPAAPVRSIERFNLSIGGTGLYRPGKWGVVKLSVRNPHDRDIELLATTHFVDNPTLQYGRRLWVPAQSRLVSWHPVRMPDLETPDQKLFELRSMVLSGPEGSETMAINEVGAMQFDQGLHVASNEPVTAIIMDFPASPATDTAISPQDLMFTARMDRGFKRNMTILGDQLAPAGEELLDAMDHLVIASDRITSDAAGVAAIRRWVAAGGRLWIMADKVSAGALQMLLGDEDQCVEVDRVDLTKIKFETGAWSVSEIPFEREVEQPVRYVRMLTQGFDIDFLVDGWPAAFHKTYGRGRILVTTLGGDGWITPKAVKTSNLLGGEASDYVPGGPLSQLALDFLTPRASTLIPPSLAEEQVRQLIGYTIPSRSLVLGALSGFTGLVVAAAVWLRRRGRLEFIGLLIPAFALVCSGILVAAGWSSRSAAPSTTAVIQAVQAVPGTADFRSAGLIGTFSKDSKLLPLSGEQGGWMMPDMAGLEGTTRRLIWTDLDKWHWQNFSMNPGMRTIAFQTAGHAAQPIVAVAEFHSDGIQGQVTIPAGLEPSDAILVVPRGRLGVEIASDGQFKANADSVLGPDQYLAASLLTDEQQRRNHLLAKMLSSDQIHETEPILLIWTRPWETGMPLTSTNLMSTNLTSTKGTVGSALVSIPLLWNRPKPETPIIVPAPFVTMREVTGPDGLVPTGLYDHRKGKWGDRSGAASSWIGFSVPESLLPVEIKSATITFKVLGPIKRLEISTSTGASRRSLKVWEDPVGTLTYDITAPEALKLDAKGRLLLRIDAGATLEPLKPSAGVKDPASYWQFEDVSLQLSGVISP